jgi:hypothetical protein
MQSGNREADIRYGNQDATDAKQWPIKQSKNGLILYHKMQAQDQKGNLFKKS